MSQNSGAIIEWLNRLLPVMGVNKISEALTGKGIGEWVMDILKIALDVKILGAAFGASAGAAITSTASTFGAGIGAAILAKIPGFATLLGGAASAATGVAASATEFAPQIDALLHGTNIGRLIIGQQTWADTENAFNEWMQRFTPEGWQDFLDNWNPESENANVIAKGIGDLAKGAVETVDKARTWVNEAGDNFNEKLDELAKKAEEAATAAKTWAEETTGKAGEALDELAKGAAEAAEGVKTWATETAEEAGEQADKFIKGIDSVINAPIERNQQSMRIMLGALLGVDMTGKKEPKTRAEEILEGNMNPLAMVQVAKNILDTPQEQNQRSMMAMLGALIGMDLTGNTTPKKPAEEIVEEQGAKFWEITEEQRAAVERMKEREGLLSDEQWNAAQNYWDFLRGYNMEDGIDTDPWEELETVFDGQEDLLDALMDQVEQLMDENPDDKWRGIEDLPADWFNTISNGLKNLTKDQYSGGEDENLSGKIATAVAGAVKGVPITVNVYVDGESVTRTVNQNLGGQLSSLLA